MTLPLIETPLDLFPLEIWEEIFKSLNTTELTACFRATPTWSKSLRDRSGLFLFPETFEILSKRLTINQILVLRCICKKWRDTVHSCLQSRSRLLQDENLSGDSWRRSPKEGDKGAILKRWLYKLYTFDCTEEIARFLQRVPTYFNPQGQFVLQNPFITRNVCVKDKCILGHPIHRERLRSQISTLLDRFGKFIWFCTLAFEYEQNYNTTSFYNMVQEWLSSLENVKILDFKTFAEFQNPENPAVIQEELEQAIAEKALPTLPHLETLRVVGLPALMMKEMLMRNGQIKKLILYVSFR